MSSAEPTAGDIASRLNLRRARPSEWRGRCVACGYADTFVLTERDGRPLWWCASCGADRDGLAAAVRRALGGGWTPPAPPPPAPPRPQAPSAAEKTARALALWAEARPIAGTPAQAYLVARGLPDVASEALRYHARCPHPSGAHLPAMLAVVCDTTTGEAKALHRKFITADGSDKAAVEPQKASIGPVVGGAVMLDAPRAGAPLVIGEGIESSLSAAALVGGAAWSAVSAGNLACLPLPPDVRAVVIAADNDPPGLRAARAAAQRWRGEERAVKVALPDASGADFNDIMRARAAREAAHAA
jgi:putative DNA primase/helicase